MKGSIRLPRLAMVLSILALLMTGCKDIDLTPGLPPETQEGKNTFGCRVDGALWLPYTEHTLDRALEPEYDAGYFTLRAERETGAIPLINLQLADTAGLKLQRYTGDSGFSASVTVAENGTNDVYFSHPDSETSITLTKAEAPAPDGSREVIISGTFSFVATSPLSSKTVRVTEGRFDIKAR